MEQFYCLRYRRDKKNTESDFPNKLKGLKHLADFGVDGRIILKFILRNRV